ncbi:MAG: alpha/beta hydrolase fold domain-containing protein [Planctomycetota bacterium]
MSAAKLHRKQLVQVAVAVGGALLSAASLLAAQGRAKQAKPAPTHRNVAYGPDERNVLDLWLAESAEPTPLVVYIHGGGFRGGSKESLNAGTLKELLASGISAAALNYRLISSARLPAAHFDCRRALQFLRHHAEKWNLDKTQVGAFGGSAGAQLCMYLAFHDEMADPKSDDPIRGESTRLTCVATNGGQTTMDFAWWMEHVPGYDKPHRDPYEAIAAESEEELHKIVEEISALSLITADDPPIHMSYGMSPDAPVPSEPERARGWKVHHVTFGVKLKEKMDSLGVEADLKYPGAKPAYDSVARFFKAKLNK